MFYKLLHFISAVLVTMLIFTSIIPSTVFSKESIFQKIQIASSLGEFNIMPADMLFIAKILRREIWDLHFIIGVSLFCVLIVFLYFIKKNYHSFSKILVMYLRAFFILFGFQFLLGIILHARSYYSSIVQYKDIILLIHWTVGVVLSVILLLHVIERIFLSGKKQ